jgi:hypothetical protein
MMSSSFPKYEQTVVIITCGFRYQCLLCTKKDLLDLLLISCGGDITDKTSLWALTPQRQSVTPRFWQPLAFEFSRLLWFWAWFLCYTMVHSACLSWLLGWLSKQRASSDGFRDPWPCSRTRKFGDMQTSTEWTFGIHVTNAWVPRTDSENICVTLLYQGHTFPRGLRLQKARHMAELLPKDLRDGLTILGVLWNQRVRWLSRDQNDAGNGMSVVIERPANNRMSISWSATVWMYFKETFF